MISIQGKGVSSGVGVGPLYFYHRTKTEIPRYTVTDPDPSGTVSRARRPPPLSSWANWPKRPAPKPAMKPPCCLRPTR